MAALWFAVWVALILGALYRARSFFRAPVPTVWAVLLIEDDPAQAYVVKEHLSASPVRVFSAHSLTEADALLQRERFDLLLLDLLLPEGSAVDLALRVRHGRYPTAAQVPILLVTGLNLPAEELLRVTQADGIFLKPLDFAALRQKVEELLRRRASLN